MAKKCIKTLKLPGIMVISILFLSPFFTGSVIKGQDQKKEEPKNETIKEYVEVVNVEMTLRALQKGKPVKGLTKSDFHLTENGEKLDITSFTEVRRKIGLKEEIDLESGKTILKRNKRRLFLFYFWVQEKRIDYRESLEYFFKKIYQESDLVLLAVKNNAIKITSPNEIKPALKQLDKILKSREEEWRKWIQRMSRNQQAAFDNYMELLLNQEPDSNDLPEPFLEKLETMRNLIDMSIVSNWQQYRYKFLTSNTNQLLALAKMLKDIPLEKWGFVYYQHMPFPVYDGWKVETLVARINVDEAHKLGKILRKYVLEMKKPPSAQLFVLPVRRAFIRANATFHLLLPDTRTTPGLENPHIRMEDVYSSWYDTFRQIAVSTGGGIVMGNLLKDSMRRVVDREDVYYRVTFKPLPNSHSKDKRNIKVTSSLKGCKIYHDSRFDVPPSYCVELSDVIFKHPNLSMTVKNYVLLGMGKGQVGDVQLSISATDEEGKVKEFMKKLELRTSESTISLKLNLPRNRKTTLLITVWDNISGLKDQKSITVR